jgi:hypothetical protein
MIVPEVSMGVQFNRGAFERALNDRMTSAVQGQADRWQRVYDQVWAAREGKTEEQVAALLRQEWRAAYGQEIPEAQLTKAVTAITEGHPIRVVTEIKR